MRVVSHYYAWPLKCFRAVSSLLAVLKVMEAVCDILKPHGELVVLIKPQFEAGKQQVGVPARSVQGGTWRADAPSDSFFSDLAFMLQ